MIHSARSIKGRARDENRDCVGVRFDGARGLFVVVDGTSRPGSGKLAQALVEQILTRYGEKIASSYPDNSHEEAAVLLKEILNDAHDKLFSTAFTGSASYLVGVAAAGLLTIAYEGDCCAGVAFSNSPIIWFTAPHCLANWKRDRDHRQLAADPGRHRVSRCFKARNRPDPEIVTRTIIEGERLVFATDGFWADLSNVTEAQLLEVEMFDPIQADDDVSWIVVQIPA